MTVTVTAMFLFPPFCFYVYYDLTFFVKKDLSPFVFAFFLWKKKGLPFMESSFFFNTAPPHFHLIPFPV